IKGKTPLVSDMDRRFTIDYTNFLSLEGLPLATNIPDFLGPEGEHEPGAYILNLKDTLALAVEYSRNYQSQKETLYETALSLPLSRHVFAPIFSANAEPSYAVPTTDVLTSVTNLVNGDVTTSDNLVEQHQVSVSGSVGAEWLIRDLGKFTTAFTVDFA